MEFDAIISGERRITARFDQWPAEIHGDLLVEIRALTAELEARVLGREPEKTGKLKSETVMRVYDDPERIKGTVTLAAGLSPSEYIKAAALEHGAPGRRGRFGVGAYRRTVTQAFGRDISPTRVTVNPYEREAHLQAQLYMRAALAEMQGDAQARLAAVMAKRSAP